MTQQYVAAFRGRVDEIETNKVVAPKHNGNKEQTDKISIWNERKYQMKQEKKSIYGNANDCSLEYHLIKLE